MTRRPHSTLGCPTSADASSAASRWQDCWIDDSLQCPCRFIGTRQLASARVAQAKMREMREVQASLAAIVDRTSGACTKRSRPEFGGTRLITGACISTMACTDVQDQIHCGELFGRVRVAYFRSLLLFRLFNDTNTNERGTVGSNLVIARGPWRPAA